MSRDFPGTGTDYLKVLDNAALDVTGNFMTISAWVNPDAGNLRGLVGKWDGQAAHPNGSAYLLTIEQTSNVIGFYIEDASNYDVVVGSTALTIGTWQNLIAVKNGTGSGAMKVYLNGVEDGSATSNRSLQNSSFDLYLGKIDTTSFFAFDGKMAEVAIWNVALTNAERLRLVSGESPATIQSANLKAYWPIYGKASPEPDLSGSGNNAAITGTVPAADHFNVVSNSETSTQSVFEPQETINNSQTSSQTLSQSVASTLSSSSTSSQSLSEALGYVESFVNSSVSSQDFGRIEIPVVQIVIDGVNPGSYYIPDGEEILVDNIDQGTVLEIVSLSGSTKTVTFLTTYVQDELELDDRVVSIPAGATRYVGSFPGYIYNSELTDLYFDQQTPGSLKFRAFSLTR